MPFCSYETDAGLNNFTTVDHKIPALGCLRKFPMLSRFNIKFVWFEKVHFLMPGRFVIFHMHPVIHIRIYLSYRHSSLGKDYSVMTLIPLFRKHRTAKSTGPSQMNAFVHYPMFHLILLNFNHALIDAKIKF